MATHAQIILIIACASLVDCRYLRGRSNKQLTSPDDRHMSEPSLKDSDAVVFPDDEEAIVFESAHKKIGASIVDKLGDDEDNKTDIHSAVKYEPLPVKAKVVPETEKKNVFTNPVVLDDIHTDTGKIANVKDTAVDIKPESLPDIDIKANETIKEETKIKLNDTIQEMNEIVPNLSNRFGVTDNYMIVPVAASVQSYQPIQTNPNVMLISTMQGNLPSQTHVPFNELNTNTINPLVANVGSNVNYATPNVNYMPTANVVPNVATNVQHVTPYIGSSGFQAPNTGSNIGSQYVAPNYSNYYQANGQVNTNTYVPVNVPNTYIINGQLYAAVTVPSNDNVPSSLYYVNPQVSSFQVANNVPLYKLVSISDGGSQVVNGNTQYVPNNQIQ